MTGKQFRWLIIGLSMAIVLAVGLATYRWLGAASADDLRDRIEVAGVVDLVPTGKVAEVADFVELFSGRSGRVSQAMANIYQNWHPGNRVMLVDVMRFTNDPRILHGVVDILERRTGRAIRH